MKNPIEISPGGPLEGKLRVPGDKSISHRALLLAAIADGTSTIGGLSRGDDVRRTALAVASLGAVVQTAGATTTVNGGRSRLGPPTGPIDVGNSGTGARLLAGYLAPCDWPTTIVGDESLSKRPMRRVVDPLRMMGAVIDGRDNGQYLPLTVSGKNLEGIEITPTQRSAQVKTAILLAGLAASGETIVHEPVPSRAHTEEMLAEFGADIEAVEHADGSCTVRVRACDIGPFDYDIPADPSAAAFWMVAASVVPNSDVTLENVYVGPGRAGLIDVLVRMGADIDLTYITGNTADVRVRHSKLTATDIGDDEIVSLIDELPVVSIAAAMADGTTTVRNAEELRTKESDRISSVVREIGSLGLDISEAPDGFSIRGNPSRPLNGGVVDAALDHRIAMTAAIAALAADEPVKISGWQCVATSYPDFLDDLARLRSKP